MTKRAADGAVARATSRDRPTPKSAETRARIVAGALRALEDHGLPAVTTRLIAEHAGVRLATLHYHFSSKEAVLLAVLDGLVSELMETLQSDTGACATIDLRISSLLHAAWAYAARTRAKQIVQYELTLYALRTRGSEWLAARQYDGYVAAYAAQVRGRGADADRLTDDQARDLARLLLAGIDGLLLQALSGAAETALLAGLETVAEAARTRAHMFMAEQTPDRKD